MLHCIPTNLFSTSLTLIFLTKGMLRFTEVYMHAVRVLLLTWVGKHYSLVDKKASHLILNESSYLSKEDHKDTLKAFHHMYFSCALCVSLSLSL